MTDDTTSKESAEFPSANAVIAAFGGIRPMAARLDVPVSTVQGWKQRDAIPDNRFDEIRAAARADGIDLDALPGDDGDTVIVVGGAPASEVGRDDGEAATAREAPAETAAPPATPTSAASAQPSRGGGGGATAIAIVALIVAAGVGGWSWWSQQQAGGGATADRLARFESEIAGIRSEVAKAVGTPAATTDQVKALGARLDALADKLDGITAGAPDGGRLDALSSELDDVKSAISDLHAATSANTAAVSSLRTGIDNTLSDLSGRLLAVENRDSNAAATEARAVGLAIAVSETRRALRSGAPYAGELATLRALAPGDDALAQPIGTLAAAADAGLPTVATLARLFDARIGAILSADRTRADAPWYRQALDRIADVVTVRRTDGNAAGDSAEAVVARTEAKLADGDLAGAVTEVATLTGPAAAAAAAWLADARSLLAAEQALATINARALAGLAGAQGN